MKTKLMIIALTFCSSLAVAGDPTAAPQPAMKKKLMKPAPSSDKAQQVDETVLGNNLGSVGTGGLSTAGTAPAKKSVRGTAPAPTK
jgi:hypothetical protein